MGRVRFPARLLFPSPEDERAALLHSAPVLRRIGAVVVAALLAFHAWLLVGLVADGRLAEPARLLRWAVALVLVAAFAAVSRTADRSVRRRRLIALSILAALLHAPALTERFDDASIPVESTLAILTNGFVPFAIALLAASFLGRPRRDRVLVARRRPTFVRRSSLALTPASSPFAPRPPTGSQIFFRN